VTFSGARVALFAAGLAAVASLPVIGRTLRSGGGERCAYNGVPVRSATKVRVREAGGRVRAFCCVDCARRWFAAEGGPSGEIFVTDEATGTEVGAADAWFVTSRVTAFAPCACHVHVFASAEDARRHAKDYDGTLLEGASRPLAPRAGGGR